MRGQNGQIDLFIALFVEFKVSEIYNYSEKNHKKVDYIEGKRDVSEPRQAFVQNGKDLARYTAHVARFNQQKEKQTRSLRRSALVSPYDIQRPTRAETHHHKYFKYCCKR